MTCSRNPDGVRHEDCDPAEVEQGPESSTAYMSEDELRLAAERMGPIPAAPTCAVCGGPAACFGAYGADSPPAYSCDHCCVLHSCEDGYCCQVDVLRDCLVDSALGLPVEGCAPVASPRDVAVARVRQALEHVSTELRAALESDLVAGADALDLARAVSLVAVVRARLAKAAQS